MYMKVVMTAIAIGKNVHIFECDRVDVHQYYLTKPEEREAFNKLTELQQYEWLGEAYETDVVVQDVVVLFVFNDGITKIYMVHPSADVYIMNSEGKTIEKLR